MPHPNSPCVLVVHDDPAILEQIRGFLDDEFHIRVSQDREEALGLIKGWEPAVVLLDGGMLATSGLQLGERIKQLDPENPAQVIILLAQGFTLDLTDSLTQGIDDFLQLPAQPAEWKSRVALNARLYSNRKATVEMQAQLDSHHEALKWAAQEAIQEVLAAQDVTLLALAKVAESRDNETGEHIARMRDYAHCIAMQLRADNIYPEEVDDEFVSDIYRSAPLHDVGKVATPDAILLKPGKLSGEEMEVMKQHAVTGANILHNIIVQSKVGGFLTMAALIARFHHERWDGLGYPAGLFGTEIPLAARIVTVADVFDALTSERPYKVAWEPEDARVAIAEGAGSHFDPLIAKAFDACFDEILSIQARHSAKEEHAVGAMAFREFESIEITSPC